MYQVSLAVAHTRYFIPILQTKVLFSQAAHVFSCIAPVDVQALRALINDEYVVLTGTWGNAIPVWYIGEFAVVLVITYSGRRGFIARIRLGGLLFNSFYGK